MPLPVANRSNARPVVVGSGPAGLLAGYYLAAKGYRPLILERGKAVKERVPAIRDFDRGGPHDPENNYLFGEGGAGLLQRRQAHLPHDRAGRRLGAANALSIAADGSRSCTSIARIWAATSCR